MFRDLEAQQDGLWSGLAAHRGFGANLGFGGETEAASGLLVSGGYFPTLRLQPAAGRLFGPDDDATLGGSDTVVLSHGYWSRRFGLDADVIGQTLIVNGRPMTIIGVAEEGFRGITLGDQPDVFVPISMRAQMDPGFDGFENRRSYWIYVFARLAPGVDRTMANTRLNVIYQGIVTEVEAPLQDGMTEATMARFLAKKATVAPGARGQSGLHDMVRTPLLLLFTVAGVVLLIACANIANLLLARSVARAGEIAVRLSVGASRLRLVGQLLTESCLLAVLGGAAGLLVARWTLRGIGALMSGGPSGMFELGLDPRIVVFSAALALGTGLLFGLFPALQSTRLDLATVLKGQSGQPSGARGAARFRTILVTTQIALSTTLLVFAGLFTKSLLNVSRVDLGIDADRLVTFMMAPEQNGYTPEQSRNLFMRVEDDLAALPGVERVTASMVPILSGNSWGNSVSVEGFENGPDVDNNSRMNEVGPGYFRTLGVPLIAGREFTASDAGESPKVAIVNEAFAKKFGLGREAVGKRMAVGIGGELDIEIVGLVSNAKYAQVKDDVPAMYVSPYRQNDGLGFISFYVRVTGPVDPVLRAIPQRIAALDPNLPIEELKTMPQQVQENVFLDRLLTVLAAAFALLATLLAAIGLYGVLAYTVSQRTRELGLRMVLGADAGRVLRLILQQVGKMAAVGGTLGLIAALGLGHLARSQLFELESYDPVVLGLSALLLAAVAIGSGLVPAMRASRIEPMRALRYE